MKLIGAGMPRTGTLTQKAALEQLGLGPCFHWVNILADLKTQVPLWNGLAATAGYRFRHISNAGQSRSNPGLNSNLLIAGLAYAF